MGKSLVLGFFDGVHKGHRAVIESAFKFSEDVALITFKDSPSLYFNSEVEYILSRKNSIEKMKSLGVKEVVELDFSKIVNIQPKEYIEYLVDNYHPISITVGGDHTFGYNKKGNWVVLDQYSELYHYKDDHVPMVWENNEIVSSTLIKSYLKNGNVEYANYLLESNFILEGTVIHGAKLGRTIGFPTANIKYPEKIVKIPYGVYSAFINGKKTIMNWGLKPTVNNTNEPVVEAHIIDFDGDLYGHEIKIEVLKQIRGEKKFENLDELKAQIQEDIKKC